MHPYPHLYTVTGRADYSGHVRSSAEGLPVLEAAPPIEFDGPGNLWSPETLLCSAVGNCLILTFRAIARASKFEWQSVECRVEGRLERAGGVSRFTQITFHVTLSVAEGVDASVASRLMEKSEQSCLISNSLNATRELKLKIQPLRSRQSA